jgi:hypothetical protein
MGNRPAPDRHGGFLRRRRRDHGGRTGFDAYERPDFAALIYSPQADTMIVPPDAPPLFLACAIDDPNVPATESIATWQAWHGAGRPADLHVFATGGHGFGTTRTGHGTDAWIDLYGTWLRGLGLSSQEAGSARDSRVRERRGLPPDPSSADVQAGDLT